MPHGPDVTARYPITQFPQVGFLKNLIDDPNIIVGDYTYYDDPDGPQNFIRNVLYHYPFVGDKLIIGRFCAIAKGAKFIMNGANHKVSGISTYPFGIFGNGWEKVIPSPGDLPYKGDTVIGNDVWVVFNAVIMPGVKIGDGAIIATNSVVVKNVPAYTVVGGNPGREIKSRFSETDAARLQRIAWWDWPIEKITVNLEKIVSGDIDALESIS